MALIFRLSTLAASPLTKIVPEVMGGDAVDHPDGGRFTGPVRAEEAEAFPLLDFEGNPVHGGQVAELLSQAFSLDDCFHGIQAAILPELGIPAKQRSFFLTGVGRGIMMRKP